MPGIVGLITKKPRPWAEEQLKKMMAALHHESNYNAGKWIDESLGIYAGWVARRNSFGDSMPLENEQQNRVLLFAGEEYPEPGTADRLKAQGHVIEGKGPAYLVHVAEDEPDFPRSLNGRFHGLLVDRTQGTALLFNDRYGMNRLYYHEGRDGFYFSAEAKGILNVLPGLGEVDPRSLGEFASCGCVLENRTLFRELFALPPGSAWTFRNGRVESKGVYFRPCEWENQEPLDAEAYYRELREVFSRNLPRYFNGHEPIGISLTGGLDTRMIMAWFKAAPQSLPSYTFGGPFRDCQDVVIARKVARICQQPHEVIPVGKDFLSRFAHYAERAVYLSDGCAPVNRAADLYANEIAAEIAPVRMTGNYGSEILRRLRAFKATTPAPGLFHSDLLASVDQARQTYATQLEGHAVTFTAFRQAPWYQYGLLSLEQTQLTLRSPFLDNDLVRTAFRAPNASIPKSDIFEDNDDCARLIADGNSSLQRLRTDRGLGGVPGSWMTPAVRGYQEFTFRAEYAYDYGMPQWLVRIDHALSPLHLERLFLGRHKFCHFRIWYRDQLASYVREILLDSRSLNRSYVDGKAVESMVRKHLKGEANYTTEIHRLLTLELQHRMFLDAR
jgi:asparagine synthase (glutamine-hydrolysing)